MHAEVFATSKGWYWHFKNKGRITANNEAFPTKAHAVRAVKSIVRAVLKPVNVYVLFTTERDDTHVGVTRITWS